MKLKITLLCGHSYERDDEPNERERLAQADPVAHPVYCPTCKSPQQVQETILRVP